MCAVLKEQLEQAHDRELKLIKQVGEQSRQIGTVIENKFETVRVLRKDIPQADKPAMPLEQLMDVEAVDDQQFIQNMSEITH
jgi:hypothetical protein